VGKTPQRRILTLLSGRKKPARMAVMHQRTAALCTRSGCHLCDEAQARLVEYGFQVESVDIDTNPFLKERYGHVVPVVVVDGKRAGTDKPPPRPFRQVSIFPPRVCRLRPRPATVPSV
jgi:glutaredoxin